MVQCIAKASGLVTAFNRIVVTKTEFPLKLFYKENDLFIVWGGLDLSEDPVFCSEYRLHSA